MSEAALTDSTTPAVAPALSLAPTLTSPTKTRSPSCSWALSVMPTANTSPSALTHSWDSVYLRSVGRLMEAPRMGLRACAGTPAGAWWQFTSVRPPCHGERNDRKTTRLHSSHSCATHIPTYDRK